MSDYFAVEICVGGDLPAADLEGLWRALAADVNFNARYGGCEATEHFCQEHGLAYRRHSDAYAEHDGEIVGWEPGLEQPHAITATQDGEITVPLDHLEAALALGQTLEQVVERYRWFEAKALPPFRVVYRGIR